MTLVGPRSGIELSTGSRSQGLDVGYPSATALAVLMMLASYIVLKPYYLLPSGLPQVADMILALALPFAIFLPQTRLTDDGRGFRFYIVLFCSYAALVNLGWTFGLMDPHMAVTASFYVFNLCVLIICLRIGTLHPRTTLLTIAYAIAFSSFRRSRLCLPTTRLGSVRSLRSITRTSSATGRSCRSPYSGSSLGE